MIVGLILTITLILAIYGIPLFFIGLFLIIFRNAESKIEPIKSEHKGGKEK